MRVGTLVAVAVAALLAPAAIAWAQTTATPPTVTTTADPIAALWSLLGASPLAAVLYAWIRSEKAERAQEQTERRAAQQAKDAMMTKMIDLLEADVEHKAELRARLKGQDDLLARMQDTLQRLERKAGPA